MRRDQSHDGHGSGSRQRRRGRRLLGRDVAMQTTQNTSFSLPANLAYTLYQKLYSPVSVGSYTAYKHDMEGIPRPKEAKESAGIGLALLLCPISRFNHSWECYDLAE